MKFCTNCGKQIDENAIFCPHCGARTNGSGNNYNNNNNGGGFGGFGGFGGNGGFGFGGFDRNGGYTGYDNNESTLVMLISFFVWQIGLILWLIWRRMRPGKAVSAAKGALARLSFSMPILGGVLWAAWKDDRDQAYLASIAGKAALIGAIFYAGVLVLVGILALVSLAVNNGVPLGDGAGDVAAFILGCLK